MRYMTQPIKAGDIVGSVFSRLTVTSIYRINGRARCLCKCICGNPHDASVGALRQGEVRSCGCLKRDVTVLRNTTHGLSKTKEYKIYHAMKKRCLKPKCKDFPDYGGRGIKICR